MVIFNWNLELQDGFQQHVVWSIKTLNYALVYDTDKAMIDFEMIIAI